ncbi:helix-turn-helix transcriptional regulator [Pseudomonas sp. p106]|uniref:XRE family transcriptional regulator n=1 Tax=Pseudomonas sp. p106 TaxID=2479854 RepID=UPI000F794C40|nr:helix-turn-helix transcriptional regulator [Pseudomonas sp. p106]RRV49001.1 helix-turn-helix transcriptional regulator [Pseudomonas sp. p106]
MNLSQRIKAARKHARLTQSELAEIVGIAQTAVSQLESGKTLRSTYIMQIAQACGVNSLWLAFGDGEMLKPEDGSNLIRSTLDEIFHGETREDSEANLALRERLEAVQAASRLSPSESTASEVIPYLIEMDDPARPGRTTLEISVTASLQVNGEVLRRNAVDAKHVVAIAVTGNSMSPVLQDGSSVLVDMRETLIRDGKIYAIDHDGQIRVKTAYRLPGGGIRIRSYNTAEYPDETYSPEDLEDKKIRIIGRVFWGVTLF